MNETSTVRKTNHKRTRLLLMMCQFRPVPSNPLLNAIRMVQKMSAARKKGARLIMFGETALQGYSIYDELKNPDFYQQSNDALNIIWTAAKKLKIGVILGYFRQNVSQSEKWANNSLLCFIPPGISNVDPLEYSQDKILIPFEKELTENLYIQEGKIEDIGIITLDGLRIGFNICQDSWQALSQVRRFRHNPVKQVTDQNPDVFVNLSCSPFYLGKTDDMIYNVLSRISRDHHIPVLYLGIVGLDGGQLVLGGYSQIIYNGEIYRHMKLFEEDEILVDLKRLHELPEIRKPQNMFLSAAQQKRQHFKSMDNAFRSVFHHLCLKHGIEEQDITLDEKQFRSCFDQPDAIQEYLDIMKQDVNLYAKKGFVFQFDGSPASILMAHVLRSSLPAGAEVCVIFVKDPGPDEEHLPFLKSLNVTLVETPNGKLIETFNKQVHENRLLPLDTFSFTDYMTGTIPRLVFGLAPFGSLSNSLIYDLLADYRLMKLTKRTPHDIDDQLVVDTILQSFLQNGKDFKSILLKSFPVYQQHMSRVGEISDVAASFLDYVLSVYRRYYNAMNHVSNRISPLSIIQLTWYSPSRYKYVNHSLSVSDWYIRQAFESIRPQLENW